MKKLWETVLEKILAPLKPEKVQEPVTLFPVQMLFCKHPAILIKGGHDKSIEDMRCAVCGVSVVDLQHKPWMEN